VVDISRARGSSQDPSDEGHPAAAGASSGAPQGGQFALGGGRVGASGQKQKSKSRGSGHHSSTSGGHAAPKPSGPRRFGYNPATDKGIGYGVKGGDADVRILQSSINRLLGLSGPDALAVDGRYGPKTTAAVKKLQKALGMDQSGQVDENLIKQVSALKALPNGVKRAMDQPTDQPDDDAEAELRDLLAGLDDEDIAELAALAEAMHEEGDN